MLSSRLWARPSRDTAVTFLPKLGQINSTIQDPLERYNAVMTLPDLFTVEPVK